MRWRKRVEERHSNWQRWGVNDERGALNLVRNEDVVQAARGIRTGTVYGLGVPIEANAVPEFRHRGRPLRSTISSCRDVSQLRRLGAAEGIVSNEDMLVLASHTGTHMDALCHVAKDGTIYNGYPAASFAEDTGAARCDVVNTATFAARAVLLDVAGLHGVDCLPRGHRISGEELAACERRQEAQVSAGDVLLVRTGWLARFRDGTQRGFAQPGLGLDALAFIDERAVAAVGADNSAVESIPFDGEFMSMHIELIWRRGITLLEHLHLEELSADGCWEMLLCVGGLPVRGAAGAPVNPIAIG
jgi:kynurenine formamidase